MFSRFRAFSWYASKGGQNIPTGQVLQSSVVHTVLFSLFDTVANILPLIFSYLLLYLLEWLLNIFGIFFPFNLRRDVIYVLSALTFLFFGYSWYKNSQKLKQRYLLFGISHSVFHHIRNEYFKCIQAIENTQNPDEDIIRMGNEICNVIAYLFKTTIANEHIGCCLRLAAILDSEDTTKPFHEYYVTYGRSKSLESRIHGTEPICSNEGLPKALSDKILKQEQTNVVIIRDIKEAIKYDLWKSTNNDEKKDVQAMIALPINTWGLKGSPPYMFGILYITSDRSKRRTPFNELHVEQAAAIADVLACALLRIMEKRKDFFNKPTHNETQ